MIIVSPWQKTCPNSSCRETFLKPDIYANPDIDPVKVGNPWHCPICNERFVVKDEISYREHIELVRKYHLDKELAESKK